MLQKALVFDVLESADFDGPLAFGALGFVGFETLAALIAIALFLS